MIDTGMNVFATVNGVERTLGCVMNDYTTLKTFLEFARLIGAEHLSAHGRYANRLYADNNLTPNQFQQLFDL